MSQHSILDRLISEFEGRARTIARGLSSRYHYVACEKYVTLFVVLHTDHIQCLRTGDFTTAVTILRSIGRLSERLEHEEITRLHNAEYPKKKLKLREERFRRGPVVCGYVAGDFREFSPKFDTSLSKILAEEPSVLKLGTWSWSRGQLDAAAVYNRLASDCAVLHDVEQEPSLTLQASISTVEPRLPSEKFTEFRTTAVAEQRSLSLD